jgi:diaminohydroxyphosphoribosylaminopyrimidine deaminase / 5-amino-6-(5-phosphoribosylamino)uracil reductase
MDGHRSDMRRALELAERGWGRVSPNPLVGAVVRAPDGALLGEGWHEGPGTDHAEVMALRAAGPRARGATIVCTLEPCNHVGRTGPCTRALIEAGIARVVVGAFDPNLGDGAPGVAELRRAGVDVVTGVLEAECRELNVAFDRHVRTGRPFVVLKQAASIDGKTAAADGSSRWITSEEARADVQRLRAWSDAIVVGSGTAVHDDPWLTVRDGRFALARPPMRVVVDPRGRLEPTARVFDAAAPTVVATTADASEARTFAWRGAGAEVLVLDRDPQGGVALAVLLDVLGKRDVQGVVIEGGARIAWSFLRDDLVDRVVLYVAPTVIGGEGAAGVVGGEGFAPVGAARRLRFGPIERIGPDLKVVADVHRDR